MGQLFCMCIILLQPLYLYSHSQVSGLYTYDASKQDTDSFDVDESEFEIPPKPFFYTSAKLLNLPVYNSIIHFTGFKTSPPTPPPDSN